MEKFARKCDVTGRGMNEGYVFGCGEMYASDKESAIKLADKYGYDSLGDAYDDDLCYYTEWEECDIDECYYDEEGNEYQVEQIEN
jgi:uncharacterized protein (UPF0128 family)